MRRPIVATFFLSLPACFDPAEGGSTATQGDTEATSTSGAETTSAGDPSTGDAASSGSVTDDPTTSADSEPDSSGAGESGSETTGHTVRCTAPEVLGTLPTLSQTLGTSVWNSRGYVTHTNDGLLMLDLSDPTNPAQLGEIGIPNPTTVVAEGTTAYVGDPTGLYVIDASNGASPVQAGVVMDAAIHYVTGVTVDATHIYATDNDNGDPCAGCGLHIIDKTSLAVVASLPIGDDAREVVVSGDHAFVAMGLEGLAVVDIAVPTAPVLVTGVALPGFTFKLDLDGDRLYTAQGDAGLGVLDIGDPTSPVELGNAPGGFVSGVAIDGNWAWVTDATPGLRVLDVADPAAIVELAVLEGFEQGAGIAMGAGFALVGSYENGARTVAPPVCE